MPPPVRSKNGAARMSRWLETIRGVILFNIELRERIILPALIYGRAGRMARKAAKARMRILGIGNAGGKVQSCRLKVTGCERSGGWTAAVPAAASHEYTARAQTLVHR